MATDGDIERTIEIINSRTDDINNLLNDWNDNQSDDTYRQNFNTHTNNILTLFERIVDIINRTPDNRYIELASNLYANLEWLLSNIDNMLGNPNNVNNPRHQVSSELGLLDKTQRITRMMDSLDAYINRNTPSSGGSRKYKKIKKYRKSMKSRKCKKKRKGNKSKRSY